MATENSRNYSLGFIALAALLFAGAAFYYANAYSRSIAPDSFRSFSVSGDGKAVGVPDVAEFSFGVVTEGGKDIAKLQSENTDKVNRAIAFVKANGVDSKDIKTENYNLSPRYQYNNCSYISLDGPGKPCPPPEIVGYSINQSVSVKVRDFTKTGVILAGVIQNGANSVSQLNFKIDDPTAVENAARAEAIQKAKNKAYAMAKAGGFSVGRLLSIQEGGGYYPYLSRDYAMPAMAGGAIETKVSTIEPGSEDVSITVTLTYEIK